MRIDGFVKIMAIVLPANGLKLSSCALNLALTLAALSSIARISSVEKSSMCRKWCPLSGGATDLPE